MVRKHARTRGVWGHARPEIRCSEIASLLGPYLYSNLYLDSMPLEYRPECFWSAARHVQGSVSHHCMCSSNGVWSKRSPYQTVCRGGTKRQILTKGGTCPWCPPGSAAYVKAIPIPKIIIFTDILLYVVALH